MENKFRRTFLDYCAMRENHEQDGNDRDESDGKCLNCGKPVEGDPEIESFCCEACQKEYIEILRDKAEDDQWSGGPEETPRLDPPWWKNK